MQGMSPNDSTLGAARQGQLPMSCRSLSIDGLPDPQYREAQRQGQFDAPPALEALIALGVARC